MTKDFPEPHENVRGLDRSENFLSLDERGRSTKRLIQKIARTINNLASSGLMSPWHREMIEVIRSPVSGDFVIEVSRGMFSSDPEVFEKAIGYLVVKRSEWCCKAEGLDPEDPDQERWVENNVFYVQYGPSEEDVCRWSNARFIRLDLP